MSAAKLFGSQSRLLLECFYKVAAIGKACFLTYIGEVKIGKEQKFSCLDVSQLLHIFLAGLAVYPQEFLGKIGIAHTAHIRNVSDLYALAKIFFNILGYVVDIVNAVLRK